MAVMIFDQPAEALTSKLAKGLSYIAEQSGNNWILPTGTNAVSGDFISVDGIMGQATAAIVGGTDAIVEGTNWSQCPSGALNALNSNITNLVYKSNADITTDDLKNAKAFIGTFFSGNGWRNIGVLRPGINTFVFIYNSAIDITLTWDNSTGTITTNQLASQIYLDGWFIF